MKKILLPFLFCVSLFAQRSDTIFQTVLNNVTVLGPSNPITNIGQAYHIVVLTANDVPGHTCTAITSGSIQLQGSFDNSTYFRIGQGVQQVTKGTPAILNGYGAYPYLRVNFIAGSGLTLCSLTANYSGSLTGTKLNAYYDLVVKTGLIELGGTSTGAGTINIGNCGSYSTTLTLYAYYINNTGAGTDTGLEIKIVDNTGFAIGDLPLGSLQTLRSLNVPNTGVPQLGNTQGFVAIAQPPVTLQFITSSAGTNYWFLYRCE